MVSIVSAIVKVLVMFRYNGGVVEAGRDGGELDGPLSAPPHSATPRSSPVTAVDLSSISIIYPPPAAIAASTTAHYPTLLSRLARSAQYTTMTRATQLISLLFLLTSVTPPDKLFCTSNLANLNFCQLYLAAYLELLPFIPALVQQEIVPVLPFWAIVAFGAYLLANLGWGVLTFKDTEGAYHELLKVRNAAG